MADCRLQLPSFRIPVQMIIEAIVSGGQTGADRAALDWALEHHVPHQGWCPNGRRAEDGAISSRYLLQETPASGYVVRTEWNVRDSDGTVIFTIKPIASGGSLATIRFADTHRKPWIHLSRDASRDPADELLEFVEMNQIRHLNVAGPRTSGAPEISDFVQGVLAQAFAANSAYA